MPKLADFVGVNTSSATPAIATNLTTGEAVQQGDILSIGADGLAYYGVDPKANFAVVRPVYQAAAAANQSVVAASNVDGATVAASTTTRNNDMATLSNGNIVRVWIEGSSAVTFGIYNNAGVLQGSKVVVGSAGSTSSEVSVCPISGGGFIVGYVSSADPKFGVYDNTGAVVVAVMSAQSSATGTNSISVASLANGNIAIVFRATSGGAQLPFVAVFSSTGTTVAAAAALSPSLTATCTTGGSVCALAQTGGGFFAIYYMAQSTGSTNGGAAFKRFNNSGVLQGSEVSCITTGVNNSGFLTGVQLQNGNVVIGYYGNAASSTYYFEVFNSTGVSQCTLTANSSSGAPGSIGQLALVANTPAADSSWFLVAIASTTIVAGKYSSTGSQAVAVTSMVGSGVATTNPALAACVSPSSELTILYSASSAFNLVVANSALSVIGAASATDLGTPNGGVIQAAYITNGVLSSPRTVIISAITSTPHPVIGVRMPYIQPLTPAGVTLASAAANTAVSTQITGNVATRLTFTQPYSVDTNSVSPPGQRMYVVGNEAVMSGFQPARRNIT